MIHRNNWNLVWLFRKLERTIIQQQASLWDQITWCSSKNLNVDVIKLYLNEVDSARPSVVSYEKLSVISSVQNLHSETNKLKVVVDSYLPLLPSPELCTAAALCQQRSYCESQPPLSALRTAVCSTSWGSGGRSLHLEKHSHNVLSVTIRKHEARTTTIQTDLDKLQIKRQTQATFSFYH